MHCCFVRHAKFHFAITFICLLYPFVSWAETYNGKIVDSMSQYSCEIDKKQLLNTYKNIGVYKALLYVSPCKDETPQKSLDRFGSLLRDAPELIIPLDSAKLNYPKRFQEVSSYKGAVGMGEIIIQHARLKNNWIDFKEVEFSILNNSAIESGLTRGYPIILHLEVYEFNEPEKKIRELEQLLSNHPNVNFLIASFGQIRGPDIERITERHANVFWLTGFTTGVSKVAQRKMLESGKGIVSQNWVNIFRQGQLRENWKGLIESYPDRFLISFYFSYPNHLKSWAPKLNKLYRSGLASLKPETAKLVACQNANRLFKLDITC